MRVRLAYTCDRRAHSSEACGQRAGPPCAPLPSSSTAAATTALHRTLPRAGRRCSHAALLPTLLHQILGGFGQDCSNTEGTDSKPAGHALRARPAHRASKVPAGANMQCSVIAAAIGSSEPIRKVRTLPCQAGTSIAPPQPGRLSVCCCHLCGRRRQGRRDTMRREWRQRRRGSGWGGRARCTVWQ
jgi:hypothetical protein